MDRKTLIIWAREYWQAWLPRQTEALTQAGEFKAATRAAARRAHAEITDLIAHGYPKEEAEEIALQKYIFLQPESPSRPSFSRDYTIQ